MATIVTLCEKCRSEFYPAFSVKLISGNTTTEKKKICEQCGRKFPSDVLRQCLVSGKGGK